MAAEGLECTATHVLRARGQQWVTLCLHTQVLKDRLADAVADPAPSASCLCFGANRVSPNSLSDAFFIEQSWFSEYYSSDLFVEVSDWAQNSVFVLNKVGGLLCGCGHSRVFVPHNRPHEQL